MVTVMEGIGLDVNNDNLLGGRLAHEEFRGYPQGCGLEYDIPEDESDGSLHAGRAGECFVMS